MIEKLMKPRYKVIADYPGNPYSISDVITMEDGRSFHLYTFSYTDEFGENVWQQTHVQQKVADEYPHLLKKLGWWEERRIEEMPLLIKNKTAIPVTFTKVDFWKISNRTDLRSYVQLSMVVDGKEKDVNFWAIEPATEEEYYNIYKGENSIVLPKNELPCGKGQNIA